MQASTRASKINVRVLLLDVDPNAIKTFCGDFITHTLIAPLFVLAQSPRLNKPPIIGFLVLPFYRARLSSQRDSQRLANIYAKYYGWSIACPTLYFTAFFCVGYITIEYGSTIRTSYTKSATVCVRTRPLKRAERLLETYAEVIESNGQNGVVKLENKHISRSLLLK